ncbi:mechanosensitive ion channel family protein [Flavicella marina]|uniref:mechanosensitive ion channel family protein n=1 Tax=Flavicella marina TaxID=1475951 RepID=UPI001265A7B5|nr:mechanosensitive ion channel domain-containing protein [Flavicella marina]
MKKTFILCVRFAIVCIILLQSVTAISQSKPASSSKDSITVVKPTFIPTIEIVDKIEGEKEYIKNILKELDDKDQIKEIDSLLPIYTSFIKDQKKSTENFIKANPNRLKITILNKKWNGYIDYLAIFQENVNKFAKKNIELKDDITFRKETWDLTYKNAKEQKIPIEVLTTVRTTLNEIKKIEKIVLKEKNNLLSLEAKISKQITASKDVIVQLQNLKNSDVYNVFYLRHPPMWKLSLIPNEDHQIIKENSESITKNLKDFVNIINTSEEQINIFSFLVLLIVLLVIYIKRALQKSNIYETGFEITRARDNLKDFTLTTILFLTISTAKYTFINTPRLFDDLLNSMILLVIIPLVKANLNPHYYKALYFIVVIYIADLSKTYLWLTIGQYKFYLLLMSIFVIVATLSVKPDKETLRKMKIGYFSRNLQKIAPTLYVLGGIAIISNVLGYTNLTETTLKICVGSGVITMLFYYILLIINSISVVIIHRHFTRKLGYDVKVKKQVQRKATRIIRVIMILFGTSIFLKLIDVLSPIVDYFTSVFSEPYKIGEITFTIGAILSFILILSGSYVATKLISFTFGESDKLFNVIKLPKGVPAAISLVVRYFIFGFGIMLSLSALGVDLSKFNLMAGALGLGIGFGLQTVISNFVSGLILVFERPILTGDTVEVDSLLGTVNRIGVRSSSITTFDGAEVIVPNNNLISNNLINWTLSNSIKRLEINIGSTYEADPNLVIKLLGEAAKESDKVLLSPAPLPLLNDFGESSMNYKLRFWVHNENGLSARSDVSIAIYNKFKENGIEIPYPHQDVYVKDLPKNKDKDS